MRGPRDTYAVRHSVLQPLYFSASPTAHTIRTTGMQITPNTKQHLEVIQLDLFSFFIHSSIVLGLTQHTHTVSGKVNNSGISCTCLYTCIRDGDSLEFDIQYVTRALHVS